MEVGGLRVVFTGDEVALRIEPSSQLERVRRALRIPGRLLVPHPLHANRPANLLRQKCRLEARIVGGRAAIPLRPFHPDDAHLIAGDLKKLSDAVPQTIGFHVVGIDRHLPVRRIGRGMGRREGRVPLEREIVFGFDRLRRACQGRVGIPNDVRPAVGSGRRATHVAVQVFRGRERRRRGLLPVDLEPPGRADGLLFPLADNGNVVALAHYFDESRRATNRRLVDADELRASHRRLHVAGVQHAGKLDVHGPFQGAVDLRGNVVALERLADDLEILNRLHLGDTGGRIDVVARERDVEPSAADQFSVRGLSRRIGLYADHALADGELIDRHRKPSRRQFQQHPPRLGCDAPHGPAVGLNRIRAARSALIDGRVGAAHDAGGLVVRDVQFIRHHLPEGRARPLTAVCFPDIEGGRAVLANDDPRIELSEVWIGIRTTGLGRRRGLVGPRRVERTCVGHRRGANAHDEQARTLEEVPSGDGAAPLLQQVFDLFRNAREGGHATPPFAEAVPAAAIDVAARLMAA